MNQLEYTEKKKEVLDRFNKDFIDGLYLYDPILYKIVHLLIGGADPYSIIEELIKIQHNNNGKA